MIWIRSNEGGGDPNWKDKETIDKERVVHVAAVEAGGGCGQEISGRDIQGAGTIEGPRDLCVYQIIAR